MSISSPLPTSTATAISRRPWRTQVETPKGQDPVVEFFRETVPVDAAGAATDAPTKIMTPISFTASAVNIAVLPEKFQAVPTLISEFADYLEQQSATKE
jgi:hypothetical protein